MWFQPLARKSEAIFLLLAWGRFIICIYDFQCLVFFVVFQRRCWQRNVECAVPLPESQAVWGVQRGRWKSLMAGWTLVGLRVRVTPEVGAECISHIIYLTIHVWCIGSYFVCVKWRVGSVKWFFRSGETTMGKPSGQLHPLSQNSCCDPGVSRESGVGNLSV